MSNVSDGLSKKLFETSVVPGSNKGVISDAIIAFLAAYIKKGGNAGAFDIGTTDDNTWGIKRNNVVVADIFSSGMRMNEGYNIINRNNYLRFTMTLGTSADPSTDTRNIADAIATKRTTNAHASSTGNIHEFANNTGVVAAVKRDGKITAVAGTAPTDVVVVSQLLTVLRQTQNIEFASLGAHSTDSKVFTLTGAAVGDIVEIRPPAALDFSKVMYKARVSNANEITAVATNTDTPDITMAAGDFKIRIIK